MSGAIETITTKCERKQQLLKEGFESFKVRNPLQLISRYQFTSSNTDGKSGSYVFFAKDKQNNNNKVVLKITEIDQSKIPKVNDFKNNRHDLFREIFIACQLSDTKCKGFTIIRPQIYDFGYFDFSKSNTNINVGESSSFKLDKLYLIQVSQLVGEFGLAEYLGKIDYINTKFQFKQNENSKFTVDQFKQFMHKLYKLYMCLYKHKKFIHNDVKVDNIRLTAELEPIIIDFGLSSIHNDPFLKLEESVKQLTHSSTNFFSGSAGIVQALIPGYDKLVTLRKSINDNCRIVGTDTPQNIVKNSTGSKNCKEYKEIVTKVNNVEKNVEKLINLIRETYNISSYVDHIALADGKNDITRLLILFALGLFMIINKDIDISQKPSDFEKVFVDFKSKVPLPSKMDQFQATLEYIISIVK